MTIATQTEPSTPETSQRPAELEQFLSELPYVLAALLKETGADEVVNGLALDVHVDLAPALEQVQIHFSL